jgi:hypothetical protein
MSYWGYGFMGGAGFYPYEIPYSCRFNDNDSAYMHRTNSATPTDAKIWTFSTWFKRCNLGITGSYFLSNYTDANNRAHLWIDSNDLLNFDELQGGVTKADIKSDGRLRDVSNWYHLVCTLDSTEAAAADRFKVWLNGATYPMTHTTGITLNQTHRFNGSSQNLYLAAYENGPTQFQDGYLAETHFIDGTAYAASDFGMSKNGVWIPKKASGISYGDDGWYLDYADSADLGDDESGNTNDLTEVNLAANDQVVDTPTNNYPTYWSLINDVDESTFSNGNLSAERSAGNQGVGYTSARLPASGKWYWECICGTSDQANNHYTAVRMRTHDIANPLRAYASNGNKYNGTGFEAYGDSYVSNDTIGVAVDVDTGDITFYKNNSTQGSADSGLDLIDAEIFTSSYDGATTSGWVTNFGQLGFTYTPPSGYRALCSANLPDPAMPVGNADKFFNIDAYTGTGAEHARTGIGFQPDVVWVKSRSGAGEHGLVDSVRGATKELNTNDTSVEETVAQSVKSFDSDGFTLGTDNTYNQAAATYVAWCWKEAAAVGFDIVQYTGTGIAHAENHSLGAVPELIIVKRYETGGAASDYRVYHHNALNSTDPETDHGILNTTASWADANTIWNDTAPTSTQFTVGTAADVNQLDQDCIAYLFRSITGFSKVFTYEGNGSNDGPFIYCGFRPRFVMLKNADGANSWFILDTDRSTYNPLSKRLSPNVTSAESDSTVLDFISNGIKLRNSNAEWNTNANTYVGIAFADQPYKYSNAF